MKRIVLIGAGFLGSALAVGAARRGWSATAISHSDPFALRDTDAGPGEIQLLPGSGVERLPDSLDREADAIVIAAGGRFPLPSAAAPVADAIGTLSLVIGLCEQIRTLSPRTKIVLLSSAGAVYAPGDEPKCESDLGEPTTPYGMSRRMGEEYMDYYHRMHGLSTLSLRCANVYGRLLPRSRGQGVISAAFWSALTRKPFTMHGTGRQTRDFIHVDDFVAATLDLLESTRDLPPTLNVGTGTGSSIVDVLEAVGKAMGTHIAAVAGPHAQTDTGNLTVDLSMLRKIIDFEPMDLTTGIGRMAGEMAADGPVWSQ
uniref:Putative 4-epimerase n=1 Tax=Amycolatopsis sp. SANK 60206 TaxID=1642649 RepID=A0A0E3Z7H7_9PSEU|nr:putative 4-epimerase [Amycolatopsis sp. SANK 60206]